MRINFINKTISFGAFLIFALLTTYITKQTVYAQTIGPGMYPRSAYLTNITWDSTKYQLECGDNAATTWAANDKVYGSIGDCRSSFNVIEISGNPPSLTDVLLNPKVDGKTWACCGYDGGKQKSSGLLAIGNTIYSLNRNWDGRTGVGLVVSTDGGKNFTFQPHQIKVKLGYPSFINFGKGYEGNTDGYVYIWGHGCTDSAYDGCERMHMIRVPKEQILQKSAYEYYAKTGAWVKADPGTLDLSASTPMATVFSCKGSGQCDRSGITYNVPLGRYIVWMSDFNGADDFRDPGKGGLGIYESPTPWIESSWKMVWHTPTNTQGWGIFSDDGIGDAGTFTTKWMSTDGRQMYMAYGGRNQYSLRKATFTVNGTPPPTNTVGPTQPGTTNPPPTNPGPTNPVPTGQPCSSSIPTNLGTVRMNVNVAQSGIYKIWSRVNAPSETADSYWLQVDSQCVLVGNDRTIPHNTWHWVDFKDRLTSNKVIMQLSAGQHLFQFIGNEAGLKLDKIILTTDLSCQPTGTGNNCAQVTISPTNNPTGTSLQFDIFLHGLGRGGDNVAPASTGNMNPLRPQRQITVEISNTNNQVVLTRDGVLNFDTTNGNFTGIIGTQELGSGSYTIRVKSQQFLGKLLTGIISISAGQRTNVSQFALVNGDANNDNRLSILDYNLLLDCFSDLTQPKNCADQIKKQSTDFTDDGSVNQFDYNLFLRELSVQSGG